MKKNKLYIGLTTLALSLSLTVCAFANDKEFKISAINLIVDVTDELNVITRNVANGDEELDILQADAIELQNSFIQNNVYLNAFPDDLSYEIIISSTQIHSSEPTSDFATLAIEDFDDYISSVENEFLANGTDELLDIGIYTNDTSKYVKTISHSTTNDNSIYVLKYYTVMNGFNYNYIMQTNDLEINPELTDTLLSIVDSAQYTQVQSSITESGLFMEIYQTFIGFGLTVLILGAIMFFVLKSTKKPQK